MELSEFERTIMPRPQEFVIFEHSHFLCCTDYPDPWVNDKRYTVWQDQHYTAKLRLYKYLKKKHRVPEPARWADSETGISKPILNF